MGKIINRKQNGMSWWARTGLVLLLTLGMAVFATVSATAATYHVRGITSVSVGTNGVTNIVAEAGTTYSNTFGGTNEYRAITNTTAPTGTQQNRIRFNAATTVTGDERFRAYTPVYATATTIAVGATAHLTAYMRTPGTSASIYAAMYEYNDTTGFVGTLKGTTNSATVLQSTQNGQEFNVTFTNPSFTVATGNRVVVVFYATVNASDVCYLYGAVSNTATPAGTTYFTLTESVAATAGTIAVSAATQTVAEAVGNATVLVTRTGGTTGSVTVDYATANGTALAGQDFTSATGTLSWAAGDATAKTITIPIINDTYDEGNETFTVTLSNATNGASLGTAAQTITITDDDGTPTIGFSAATSSGSKNTTPAAITVSLSAASGLGTSVNYTTANGTASAGTDYTTTSGTLTIPALSTTGTINVPILATGTGGKSFTITLNTPTNSTLGTATHTFTINATAATGITTCGGCHGHPAGPNLLVDSNRAAAAGTFQGSHTEHVSTVSVAAGSADCAKCHTNPTRMDHSSGAIEVAISAGGTYSKASPITISTSPTLTGGTCSSTTCHGTSSPTWGTSTTQATCTKCHGVLNTTPAAYTADTKTAAPGYNGTGRDTAGSTAATGAQVGAHDTHLRGLNAISSAIACTECHSGVNTTSASFTGHMDGTGTLSFGTLANSNAAVSAYNATSGACTNTYCHFGKSIGLYAPVTANASATWNNTAYLGGTTADCQKCHASPPSTTGIHAGKAFPTSCNTCHSHVSVAGVITDPTLHINGAVNASGGHAFPYPGATHITDAGTTPWSSCSCHNTTATGVTYATWAASGTAATRAAPNCTTCHIGGLKVPSGTSSCWDCHGSSATNGQPNGGIGTGIGGSTFPNYSGSHTAHTTVAALTCANCHFGAGAGAATHGNSNAVTKTAATISFNGLASAPTWTAATNTCSATTCHGIATWGGRVGCVNCHALAQTGTHGTPRNAVTTEFGLVWGHKKSGRGTVSDADCIVCHLEGDYTTQKTSAKHKDGNIDLRDPKGAGETAILNNSGTAFTFTKFALDLTTARGSVITNSVADVLTHKFCLACHDSIGATNPTARAFGATGTSAFMPWGGSTGYSVANGAATANGLINVKSQLLNTNSSYHPVTAPLNRDFPTAARMNAPYKPTGTRGTSGTLTASVLLNCFDCHSALTPSTTRSIVAHGNAVTIRGVATVTGTPSSTNDVTFCKACHAGYVTGTSSHAAGSALSSSTDGGMTAYLNYGCNICHSSGYATAVIRPVRAMDTHGVNVLPTTGTKTLRWLGSSVGTPAQVNAKPYAFIRNTSVLSDHSPKKIGTSVYSPNCNMAVSPCSQGVKTYTVGGTY